MNDMTRTVCSFACVKYIIKFYFY